MRPDLLDPKGYPEYLRAEGLRQAATSPAVTRPPAWHPGPCSYPDLSSKRVRSAGMMSSAGRQRHGLRRDPRRIKPADLTEVVGAGQPCVPSGSRRVLGGGWIMHTTLGLRKGKFTPG